MANSIQNLLIQSKTAVENALNDTDIKSFLSEYGYDESVLNAGKTLYEQTDHLNQQQLKEYGDQYSATEEFNNVWEKANAEYMRFVKVARIALRNENAAYSKLGLSGLRKKSFSGWFSQVDKFYTNALADPSILSTLSKFGVTQEKLEAGKQSADSSKTASVVQKKEKGEAQQATLARDNSVDELDQWLSDFIGIARIALEEKPQLLEKLGILERSL